MKGLHEGCRKNYTDPSRVERCRAGLGQGCAHTLRRHTEEYIPERDCLLCGKSACVDQKLSKDRRPIVHQVYTTEQEDSLRAKIETRGNGDQWGQSVLRRLNELLRDLPAAEVRYHQRCNLQFFTDSDSEGKRLTGWPRGRLADSSKSEVFEQLCRILKRATNANTLLKDKRRLC